MRNTIQIAILAVSTILISCNSGYKKYSRIEFPAYYDTVKNSGIDYVVDEMVMSHNGIQLIDTIDFKNQKIDLNKQPKYGEYAKSSLDGYRWPRDSIQIQILIDTSRIISTKDNRISYVVPPPPPITPSILKEIDSILNINNQEDSIKSSNVKQKIEQEKTDSWVNNYPVFIVNYTDTIISLTYEDISGFKMVQEAKDSIGTWKPIQYWHWNWCGNAYSSIDLKPKYFALTRTPKFSGEYRTKLRLKMRFFNKTYYSNEFNGRINYSQFEYPERFNVYNERERNYMLLIE